MDKALPGLSLIEVLIAVLMLGISVTTLLSLQGVLTRGVFSVHAAAERVPFIISYLFEADREKFFKQEQSQTKTLEDPSVRMTYSTGPAPSSLSTLLKVEKVEAHWSTAFGTCTEMFARLRFVPQVEK